MCNSRGGATSQVGQVFTWPLLLSCIIRWSKIYRHNYRKYYYKYYTLCMHWQCLLSLTASLPHVWKHYYIHMLFHTLFNACHVCIWPCFVHFCYAEVALPELLKEPHHSQFSTILRDLWPEETCTLQFRGWQVV